MILWVSIYIYIYMHICDVIKIYIYIIYIYPFQNPPGHSLGVGDLSFFGFRLKWSLKGGFLFYKVGPLENGLYKRG